jgi:hypothetical protein
MFYPFFSRGNRATNGLTRYSIHMSDIQTGPDEMRLLAFRILATISPFSFLSSSVSSPSGDVEFEFEGSSETGSFQ